MELVFGRALTEEDVETARAHLEQHLPSLPSDRGRQHCTSATHLINAPAWPCQQEQWARAVLAAAERGEVTPVQRAGT